jgi:S-DNA-T family DNA segregation ATPase FtsK/SpoIIIE
MAQTQRRDSSRTSARQTSKGSSSSSQSEQGTELAGLVLLAVGAFFAVVIWFGWDGGVVGGKLADVFGLLIGRVSLLIPALLATIGLLLVVRSDVLELKPFRLGVGVLGSTLTLIVAAGAFGVGPSGPAPKTVDPSVVDEYGGLLGGVLGLVSRTLIGDMGTTILCVLGIIAGVMLITGASIGAQMRRSAQASAFAARHTASAARRGAETLVRSSVEDRRAARARSALGKSERIVDQETDFSDAGDVISVEKVEQPKEPSGLQAQVPVPDVVPAVRISPVSSEPILKTAGDAISSGREQEELESHSEAPTVEPLVMPSTRGDYTLPSLSFLKRSPPDAPAAPGAQAIISKTLIETLASFGVEATLIGEVTGPRVTRYELQLAPGTKISRVTALRDDLAYALASTDIRILAPIPGKQAVGVEVPNHSSKVVTLGDVAVDVPAKASPLSVWLGKDISGKSIWADLASMPHILIAGTTGSGKSGCINAMLCSVLLRAGPDDLRMILIDPKRVELGPYESIPHLLTPVVSNPKRAAAALVNVVTEMETRYERMSVAKSRNLVEFNRVLEKRGEQRLPYLLVVIDELADLMMVSAQGVEDSIIRLAQKSRAVGIHLVLATQRPSVDVITGMIKANVPSRIAFAVSSQTDSRVILDASGAESLLGQGDMLFKPLGTSRLQRIQGAYVTEEEISLIVEHCRSQREQDLDESLLEAPEPLEPTTSDHSLDPDDDPLLDKAIDIAVQTQSASVSMIQRRLRVGYTRAGRLVDMLERRGIISGYEGSKPRRVLVTANDLADRAREPDEAVTSS